MNRPLRFLHMTTFYPPYSFGGDAMYIYRLAHALGDAGHQVDVVHCLDSYHLLHPEPPEIGFPDHPNVRRHELQSGFKWLSPLATQQTGRPYLKEKQIREVLERGRYDVIHYHNISLLGPAVLTYDAPDNGAVKIYTTHEHWLICPTHVLWKFNKRACESPQCFRCTLLAKRPPQLWRYTGLLERCSEHVDLFVSPSRFTAGMHGERGFTQPVTHLPYFIERTDRDWKVPGPKPQQAPYFLFVGRLEQIKGLQTLIPLWDGVEFDLLVAGTGSFEEELRQQAAANDRIKFLGPLSQKALADLYVYAQAVIVPSITYETFGVIMIEAFARKTPVIVRNLGALPEGVEDSGGGFVYSTDEELLSAIHQIGSSAARRAELGERGYNAFLKQWTKEAHMNMYLETLRRTAIEKFGHVPWA